MTLFALGALLLIAWLWFDGTQARERVLEHTRRACEDIGVLLLDQSVVLVSMRPARRADGRLGLRRGYRFEFSRDGDSRHSGHAWLLGSRIESIHLALPEGAVHTTGSGRVLHGDFRRPGDGQP
jgi:hypothetical protein